MTKHKHTLWQRIKQLFINKCPNCGGKMHKVFGWDREECNNCHYTRNI